VHNYFFSSDDLTRLIASGAFMQYEEKLKIKNGEKDSEGLVMYND
jgi:hypothetical protein